MCCIDEALTVRADCAAVAAAALLLLPALA
jgi:hypothetical protein